MKIWSVLAVGVLAGCASPVDEALQPQMAAARPDQPVRCGTCGIEWQRAEIWIAKHAVWRVHTSTPAVISTFAPTQQQTSYGFTVLRVPMPDGGQQIEVHPVCGNLIGCSPREDFVRRAFYTYVADGVDLLSGRGYLSGIR